MTQYEAVIQAMKDNGGYATLGRLNQTATKVPGAKWGTLTPEASIRRIVQKNPSFFKIRPGLWALVSERERVLNELALAGTSSKAKQEEFSHTYYQGLIVEIGNLKRYETFIPHQDKNRKFFSHKLSDISTMNEFHDFTYEHLLKKARTVDVSWFNERQLPNAFFEVEHSTNMQNSLLKFLDFQDFRIRFYIVADSTKQRAFENQIARHTFKPIRSDVKFLDYEGLSDLHSKLSASVKAERIFDL